MTEFILHPARPVSAFPTTVVENLGFSFFFLLQLLSLACHLANCSDSRLPEGCWETASGHPSPTLRWTEWSLQPSSRLCYNSSHGQFVKHSFRPQLCSVTSLMAEQWHNSSGIEMLHQYVSKPFTQECLELWCDRGGLMVSQFSVNYNSLLMSLEEDWIVGFKTIVLKPGDWHAAAVLTSNCWMYFLKNAL